VQNVNINMVDSLTRASAQLAHDSSGADGSFRVIVPPGTYDIQYKAPVCTGLAPDDQKSVTIAGPTALPLMALVTGAHATGLVVDDATPHANPVAGADLDFFPAGSVLKSYTPGDTTKASGDYDVLVKPGIYDIDYRPPAGSRLRPVRTSSVGVPGNVTLPTVALRSGLVLSGTVHATSTGLPVAGVRVDVFPAAGGIASWTPHNDTAVDGSFLFSVDAGTWDLQFVPPAGSGLAPRWRRGVAVGADLALGDTLLLPLTVPSVLDATPNIGSTTGGQTVTIAGSGFQPDATVLIGGVPAAGVTFVSPAAITAVTGHHPPGPVDVAVANPGAQIGARPSAYTYVEPASPVVIRLSKSGADVVLNWQANGQGTYTIFRGASATGFTSASIRGTTAGTSFTDIGGAAAGTIQFYNVD
jgi:hypothetical protein